MTRNLTTPKNVSLLQNHKFEMVFPNLPNLKYFGQSVMFPGISTSEVAQPTPFSVAYRHGDTLFWEPLTISTILDEDMAVWKETYNWLTAFTNPRDFKRYPRNDPPDRPVLYQDAILTIFTNANTPNFRIKFRDCHPTVLGGMQFDYSSSPETIVSVDITFRYDTYEFE